MLNNKGFAISSILYIILVAFLLILAVTLKQISASSDILRRANNDIIDGSKLSAVQIKEGNVCKDSKKWYESNILLSVHSRYGTMYFPKDFYTYEKDSSGIWKVGQAKNLNNKNGLDYALNNQIGVMCSLDKNTWQSCENYEISNLEPPKTSCSGALIDDVCFEKQDLLDVKEKIDNLVGRLNSITTSNNAFLYYQTNLNALKTMRKTRPYEFEKKLENSYTYSDISSLGLSIYIKNSNNNLSMCLSDKKGTDTLYIDIENQIRIVSNKYLIKDSCLNQKGTFINGINSNYRVSNNNLINIYEQEDYLSNTYPILYSDNNTFGYVATQKIVYLIKNENIKKISYDDLITYINNSESVKSNNAYFYIKIFDNILAKPDDEENDNVIVKGIYDICK